jgi:hypothetical protein
MTENRPFVIRQKIKETVSKENIILAFSQAEKRLTETLKTGEALTSRNNALVSITAAIIVALCAYIISNWKGFASIDTKTWTAFAAVGYSLILSAIMLSNILPSGYKVTGSHPIDFVTDEYYLSNLTEDQKTIALYANEIEDFQKRIDINSCVNRGRSIRYIVSVIALILMPCIIALIYFVLEAIKTSSE